MAQPKSTHAIADSPNSATFAVAVTPSDTVNYDYPTRGVYVGVAGDVVAVMADDGGAVTFTAVAAGTFMPIRVKRINSTSTTATNMVALW